MGFVYAKVAFNSSILQGFKVQTDQDQNRRPPVVLVIKMYKFAFLLADETYNISRNISFIV